MWEMEDKFRLWEIFVGFLGERGRALFLEYGG